ncbi:MAG: helix-turn-helix transcriptional regulator [Clostridiales bacterium]|jgi:transcriptional regulator with XRE-family HTH domain|nr:helix-turn-helix transcriptional regulator [Clostridiales bacterium]
MIESVDISDRLRWCRKKTGETQRDVADLLGITVRAYQNYELRLRQPSLNMVVALARHFRVSVDFLAGCSEACASTVGSCEGAFNESHEIFARSDRIACSGK